MRILSFMVLGFALVPSIVHAGGIGSVDKRAPRIEGPALSQKYEQRRPVVAQTRKAEQIRPGGKFVDDRELQDIRR